MNVQLSDAAERDLLAGIAFYDGDGRNAGDHFFDSVTSDLRSLSFLGGVHAIRPPFLAVFMRYVTSFTACLRVGFSLLFITLSDLTSSWSLRFSMSDAIQFGLQVA